MNTKGVLIFYDSPSDINTIEVEDQGVALASLHEMAVKKGTIAPNGVLKCIELGDGAILIPEVSVCFLSGWCLERSVTMSSQILTNNVH